MGKYLAALFFPCLLVILFSRATYYPIIGLILTVALIAASVYRGYTDAFLLIVVDAFSMTVGYMISRKWKEKLANKNNV
ncbi:CsbA family protein [Niallia sp.]|uniref:CsbA family protein n=1 Tax=Niallia sp. TaxID=2837523 RepID=UPI0028A1D9BB|nr:CsbA family protein [Niallia sp.]